MVTAMASDVLELPLTDGRAGRKHPVASRSLARVGLPVLSLAIGILIWQALGQIGGASLIIAPIPQVLRAWVELIVSGRLTPALVETGVIFIIGLAFSIVVGVPLGLLMGRFRFAASAGDLYVNIFMSTPSVAFIPLFLLYFGTGDLSLVAFTVAFTIFNIIVNVQSGVRNLDPNYIEMARSVGASERQIFWKILVPGAMPMTMAGLRLGIGRAVRGVITGSVVMTLTGLGGLLDTFGHGFETAKLWAIIATIVALAWLITAAGKILERSALKWQAG